MRKLFLLLALTLSAGMWANELEDAKAADVEEIKQVAATAKEEIDELGVYYTVKDQAINEIDKAVAAAEASITNADSEEQVNDAKNNALKIGS